MMCNIPICLNVSLVLNVNINGKKNSCWPAHEMCVLLHLYSPNSIAKITCVRLCPSEMISRTNVWAVRSDV